jgi:hypothetical protein
MGKMDRVRKELETEIKFSEEEEEEEAEWDDEEEEKDPLSSVNTPITSSPLYPRFFVGHSGLPIQNLYPNSEYVDDNISRTWQGLMSFYG